MSKFYLTTPIYYPNAEPHLGHVYTTICADVLARFHRLAGDETFLLTGTDEHGIKMVNTAAEKGLEPHQLAERMSGVFRSLWQELSITHDDFIQTSSPRHQQCVQSHHQTSTGSATSTWEPTRDGTTRDRRSS